MRTVDSRLWHKYYKKPSTKIVGDRFGRLQQTDLEACIRLSFRDAFKELMEKLSVKNMFWKDNSKIIRQIITLVRVLIVVWGITLTVFNVIRHYRTPPLLYTMVTDHVSVSSLDLPAVALCPYNIINRRRLKKFTKLIMSNVTKTKYSESEVEDGLLSFGALINKSPIDMDLHLMDYLESILPTMHMSDVFNAISTPCQLMLSNCSLRGKKRSCEELFKQKLTDLGLCCIFNNRFLPQELSLPSERFSKRGFNYGLTVEINQNTEDYAFIRKPSRGVEVLLFDRRSFLLLTGGNVNSYSAWPNSVTYIPLNFKIFLPGYQLDQVKEVNSGCRNSLNGMPDYNHCLWRCILETAKALCECVLPNCRPDRLACLNKYKELFQFYYPQGYELETTLGEELRHSLNCLDCLPDCLCNQTTATPYYTKIHSEDDNTYFSTKTTSVLHVFFSSSRHEVYMLSSNLRWDSLFSWISCQWMLVCGVTFIQMLEVIFHLTIRWRHHYKLRRCKLIQA